MDDSELEDFRNSVFWHYAKDIRPALEAKERKDAKEHSKRIDNRSTSRLIGRTVEGLRAWAAEVYLESADHRQAISFIRELFRHRAVRRKLYLRLKTLDPVGPEEEKIASIVFCLTDVLLLRLSSKGIVVPASANLFAELTELVVKYGPESLLADDWETLPEFLKPEESRKFGKIEANPELEYAEELHAQASGLIEDEKPEEALELIEKALRIDDADAAFHDIRGHCFYQLNRFPEALAEFDRAILLDSEHYPSYLNRGCVHHNVENYELAELDYSIYLERDTTIAEVYLYRAQCRIELEKYQEALNDLDRSIELDGGEPEAFYERARVLCTVPDYMAALSDIDAAIEMKPDDIDYRELRSFITTEIERG